MDESNPQSSVGLQSSKPNWTVSSCRKKMRVATRDREDPGDRLEVLEKVAVSVFDERKVEPQA